MRFPARAVFLLLSILSIFQCAIGSLTPDQVVSNIRLLTTVSGNINDSLGKLTTSASAATVRTTGQTLVEQFTVIINGLRNDITAMQSTPPFTDDVTGPIVNALTDFVEVHQLLLSTVIGKRGIFAQFAVTAPIAAVLRTLEGAIDSFAFSLIALIPTRKSTVSAEKSALDDSVGKTISTYTQICIPSPLYPTIMPVCL